MTRIEKNYFIPMVSSIRVDIVRVSDGQVRVLLSRTPLGNGLQSDSSAKLHNPHSLLATARYRSLFSCSPSSQPDSDYQDP